MVWRCHRIFCLEPTLGKNTWMRAGIDESDLHQCYGILFKNLILKVTWSQLYSKCIDNSILKDTLQLKILRAWIKIRANSFIKTWVNIIKRKSAKVLWKLSLAKKYDPTLQRTLHKSRWHCAYCYMLPFLSNKPNF